MPAGIQSWIALTLFLAGVLVNVYLGLYISEKCSKVLRGIRILICNQIFANLLGLFSHAFLPTHNERLQEPDTRLEYVCKIMPSLGFVGVAVSLSNFASLCVVCYYKKRTGVVLSERNACLIVINLWLIAVLLTTPLALSLDSLEITVTNTTAKMCAIVWQNRRYEEAYMNYVFLFKFFLPQIVILTFCLKMELHLMQRWKFFQRYANTPAIITEVVAATCFFLLVYFYPLHNACSGNTAPFVKMFGASAMPKILSVLELFGLANCSTVPLVLKSCIDEYSNDRDICDAGSEKDCPNYGHREDGSEDCILTFPSSNASVLTYDVLNEHDEPISIRKTEDVKILIVL